MLGTRFVDLVAWPACFDPDKIAVVDENRQLTFADVDGRAHRFARWSQQLCGASSDAPRVAVLALNEAEMLEMQVGAMRAGVTLVPLNHRLSDQEIEYILRDCRPQTLVAGRTFDTRAAGLVARGVVGSAFGLGSPTQIASYEDALLQCAPDFEIVDVDPATDCLLMYTSGTTGRPKGALFDRAAVSARMLVNLKELEIERDSVFLQSLPMFHVSGLLGYAHTYGGATMILLESFDADRYLELIEEWGVTSTALVPTTLAMLVTAQDERPRDIASLELLIYGGSSIHPDLLRRAMAALPVRFHQQYGMTETMGGLSILRPADHDPSDEDKLASGGTPAASYHVAILDGDGNRVPHGEVGEICCASPAMMKGYVNLPEVTEQTMRDGWLRTGDLGTLDERGFIHVVDRKNNMIITGGENVYPREVEDVLLAHPGVDDAAIVSAPDPLWGERIIGVVLDDAPGDDVLDSYLRQNLAGYKVPKQWHRLSELPRNVTGKLVRSQISDLIAKGGN